MISCLNVITELWSPAGTTKFVVAMSNALSSKGDRVTIAIRDIDFPNQTMPNPGVDVITIKDLLASRGTDRYDVVHIHGIWNYQLHRVVVWARKQKIPIVFSPHGMLTQRAMRFKWWKKILPWLIYQKWDCACACLWHATTEAEEQDIRRCGFSQPCVVCPLGVEVPNLPEKKERKWRRMLFLSRVHPTKGVDNLISAWQAINHEGWQLIIAGPCEAGYRKKLDEQIDSRSNIEFIGAVYGEEKVQLYVESDAFVLPTYTENFGVVIAEALACGIPVITTHGAPWSKLEEINAGYWIPVEQKDLEVALKKMVSLPDKVREEMGLRGREYVRHEYDWKVLADRMRNAYERVAK